MGRDDDHLQGIFRLSYDLLASSGQDATWVTWDHPLHGYIFPVVGTDGAVQVDDTASSRSSTCTSSAEPARPAMIESGAIFAAGVWGS